jgi:excisionase family DNA binding protein
MITETTPVTESLAEVLTVEEAARFIRMSVDYVYRASADGRLPCIKQGRRTVFLRSSLTEWLKSLERGGGK